jgi:hypothetical protein
MAAPPYRFGKYLICIDISTVGNDFRSGECAFWLWNCGLGGAMAEDLLDYWVRLIKPIFPANAWINSRFLNDGHLIQIDWKLADDPREPDKRSKKIEIIIKERTIDHYLEKCKNDRALSDILLKEFICGRYNSYISDTSIHASASTETWNISTDVLNGKPSVDAPRYGTDDSQAASF